MNEHDSLVSHALNNMSLNELAHTYADLKLKVKAMQKVVYAATEYWAFCKATGWETSDDNHYLPKALSALDGEAK